MREGIVVKADCRVREPVWTPGTGVYPPPGGSAGWKIRRGDGGRRGSGRPARRYTTAS